jgi:hypothetical protein
MAGKGQKWSSTSSIWTCLKGFGVRDLPEEDTQVIELIGAEPNGLSTELNQQYRKGYYTQFLNASGGGVG